jgi:hypothetical protein
VVASSDSVQFDLSLVFAPWSSLTRASRLAMTFIEYNELTINILLIFYLQMEEL